MGLSGLQLGPSWLPLRYNGILMGLLGPCGLVMSPSGIIFGPNGLLMELKDSYRTVIGSSLTPIGF